MTVELVVVGVVCLLVGWFGRGLWDDFCDWLEEATGAARSVVWDLFAVLGIIAASVAVGWIVAV